MDWMSDVPAPERMTLDVPAQQDEVNMFSRMLELGLDNVLAKKVADEFDEAVRKGIELAKAKELEDMPVFLKRVKREPREPGEPEPREPGEPEPQQVPEPNPYVLPDRMYPLVLAPEPEPDHHQDHVPMIPTVPMVPPAPKVRSSRGKKPSLPDFSREHLQEARRLREAITARRSSGFGFYDNQEEYGRLNCLYDFDLPAALGQQVVNEVPRPYLLWISVEKPSSANRCKLNS